MCTNILLTMKSQMKAVTSKCSIISKHVYIRLEQESHITMVQRNTIRKIVSENWKWILLFRTTSIWNEMWVGIPLTNQRMLYNTLTLKYVHTNFQLLCFLNKKKETLTHFIVAIYKQNLNVLSLFFFFTNSCSFTFGQYKNLVTHSIVEYVI